MKFKITHTTEYSFDSEVFIEPHFIRLRPRKTAYLAVLDSSIVISPDPSGHRNIVDEENNLLDFYWFDGMVSQLKIKSESTVEVKEYNPFDFILHPQKYNQLPFEYDKLQKSLLYSSLVKEPIAADLLNFGATILAKSNNNTISFLISLTSQLHQEFLVEYREDGPPLLPDETFKLKRGSCRDLSWMQIHLLRNMGIAARFASGYFYFEMDKPSYELHAWVEVYLPGAGWLGLDPSHGILTGNTHIPVASSAHYENTMPVSGSVRGSANSTLNTELVIAIV